jgi:hypothetical protein
MRRSTTTAIGFVGPLALAGLLIGCAGGDDGSAESVPSASAVVTTEAIAMDTTTAVTEPLATDAPAESEPEPTDPPVTDAPAVAAGECLVGDWVVTEEQMDAYYAGLMSTLEAPLGLDTAGSAPLSFAADGTYAWAPAFSLVVEVAGQSGTGEVAGTVSGDWMAADGVVVTSSDVEALTVSITVNGITFEGADLANGLLNTSPVNGVTYSCDGPTPVLDFQTADPELTVPVTLVPA